MFKKILIAEDQGAMGRSLQELLSQNDLKSTVSTTTYCDDAFTKLKAAHVNEKPYDLLITDLSFKPDHVLQKLSSGEALIEAIRETHIHIRIIVLSIENRVGLIKKLFDTLHIDGFVEKGRTEIPELLVAIKTVHSGNIYKSSNIQFLLKSADHLSEIDKYDTLLLQLAAQGYNQEEIAAHMKKRGYKAGSLRSVQKRFNELKIIFDVKTSLQLMAKTKDLGLV